MGSALALRSHRSHESQPEIGCSGAERALYRVTSLTLTFDLHELRQDLSQMEQPSPLLSAQADSAAPSAMMLEMVRGVLRGIARGLVRAQ